MECKCGCGLEVKGINQNTRKPIAWRPGHRARLHPSSGAQRRAAELRASWPTKDELQALVDEHGGLSQVGRILDRSVGGVRHIARQLGVTLAPHGGSMPRSEVRFGWSGEDHAALILGAASARNARSEDTPFDLRWHGKRLEVKTSRPVAVGSYKTSFWMFHVKRNHGKCDAYFCIGCDQDGLPQAYFLVPESVAPASKLSIPTSCRSKWAQYLWTPPPVALPAWLSA